MANSILRLEPDPDRAGVFVEILMTDEEWLAAYDPQAPNVQIIRDKIAAKLAAETNKKTDFSEMRDAKLTTVLDTLNSDIAILAGSPTNGQVVAAVRRLLNVMIVLVKIVARLV